MKKAICFLLCAVIVVCFAACGSKSIKGEWVFGANTYEFNEDGTFASSFNGINQNGKYTVEDGKITLVYTGLTGVEAKTVLEYKLSKDTLTLSGDVSLIGTDLTVDFTRAE